MIGPNDLAFPDHDGNGMFKSFGNIAVPPAVGLLFIAMGKKPARLRVNGTASVRRDDSLVGNFLGAQLLVRVQSRANFPNCGRYIPMADGPSLHIPQTGKLPVEPPWKSNEDFRDTVPTRASPPLVRSADDED